MANPLGFSEKMDMFIDSMQTLNEERKVNQSDISQNLEIEISQLLSDLGSDLERLDPRDLDSIHEKFSMISETLLDFAKDTSLWNKDSSMPSKLRQAVATVKNVTNRKVVPDEVVKMKGYHGNALNLGLMALSALRLPPVQTPSAQEFALNYANDKLNAVRPEIHSQKKGAYLIRPSSSVASEEGVKVVTVSFLRRSTSEVKNIRIFHDASQTEKPWTMGDKQFDTLQEAINALFPDSDKRSPYPIPPPSRADIHGYVSDRYTSFED
jgi:hypothetical protein